MEKFRRDAECRVFLSTDAGGVGLNLQAASAVINFEPPWNPARLEQRIGRVHRLGQAHPVHVVHLLTKDSIEERVWETLKLKKSLFAGVFDSPTGEVSFAALGKKSVLQSVKEIFANQPGRRKPLVDQPPSKAVPVQRVTGPAPPVASPAGGGAPSQSAGFEQAAAGLIETGVRFLESLAAVAKLASCWGGSFEPGFARSTHEQSRPHDSATSIGRSGASDAGGFGPIGCVCQAGLGRYMPAERDVYPT
jgi:hypothetical protein